MKTNIGFVDRIVRLVIGCALLGIGYYFQTWWGLIGILPLLTAAFGFCPAYLPFGINTCGLKDKE